MTKKIKEALSGNKGEWSEIYALIKLIADKGVHAGDPNLKLIKEIFYPIVKILRTEKDGLITYEYIGNIVIVTQNGSEIKIEKDEFIESAAKLFKLIKSKKREAAFTIPELEDFLERIKTRKLKAENSSKADIKIVMHDARTTADYLLGFSIKSKLGSDSTIVNSSQLTNFIFKVDGINDELIDEINQMYIYKKKKNGDIRASIDVRRRTQAIINSGAQLKYVDVSGKKYKNNLILISDRLPEIIANMLVIYYYSGVAKTTEICNKLKEDNPLNYDTTHNHDFYSYKVKKFLIESALGMVAKDMWTGYHDATGGYIVVKEDGDVLCYHLYNRNDFEDYLFNSTSFDTPSTSRNEFGYIYNEDGIWYYRLNIQVKYK